MDPFTALQEKKFKTMLYTFPSVVWLDCSAYCVRFLF